MNVLPKMYFAIVFTLILCSSASLLAQDDKLSQKEMEGMLAEIDSRQQSVGDYKARVILEQRDTEKSEQLFEVMVYRRDSDETMVLLFLKPKSSAGSGYILNNDNLFYYLPGTGKWERRTLRERIAGTDSRHQDFGTWEWANNFKPTFKGTAKLGKFQTYHLRLNAKEDADVAFPIQELWIDRETKNVLKIQSFSLSGKLMRTSYYPKWLKVENQATGDSVYVPKEIRHYDELEKGRQTIMFIRQATLAPLPDNTFTKAWFESKSR